MSLYYVYVCLCYRFVTPAVGAALRFNVMEGGREGIRYWLLQFAGLFFRFAAGIPESSDMDAISLYVID